MSILVMVFSVAFLTILCRTEWAIIFFLESSNILDGFYCTFWGNSVRSVGWWEDIVQLRSCSIDLRGWLCRWWVFLFFCCWGRWLERSCLVLWLVLLRRVVVQISRLYRWWWNSPTFLWYLFWVDFCCRWVWCCRWLSFLWLRYSSGILYIVRSIIFLLGRRL